MQLKKKKVLIKLFLNNRIRSPDQQNSIDLISPLTFRKLTRLLHFHDLIIGNYFLLDLLKVKTYFQEERKMGMYTGYNQSQKQCCWAVDLYPAKKGDITGKSMNVQQPVTGYFSAPLLFVCLDTSFVVFFSSFNNLQESLRSLPNELSISRLLSPLGWDHFQMYHLIQTFTSFHENTTQGNTRAIWSSNKQPVRDVQIPNFL